MPIIFNCCVWFKGRGADEENRKGGRADLLQRPRQEGVSPVYRQPRDRVKHRVLGSRLKL